MKTCGWVPAPRTNEIRRFWGLKQRSGNADPTLGLVIDRREGLAAFSAAYMSCISLKLVDFFCSKHIYTHVYMFTLAFNYQVTIIELNSIVYREILSTNQPPLVLEIFYSEKVFFIFFFRALTNRHCSSTITKCHISYKNRMLKAKQNI